MKKLLCVALVVVMMLSLVACSKKLSGTYEITENDDGTMEITINLETEDDHIKSGTYTFEEGEDYIKIGPSKLYLKG